MAMMRHREPPARGLPDAAAAPWPGRVRRRSPARRWPVSPPLRMSPKPLLEASTKRSISASIRTGAIAVAVDVAPDAAGELAEGDGGDLVDAVCRCRGMRCSATGGVVR